MPTPACRRNAQSRVEHFKKKELRDAAERGSEAARGGYCGPDCSGQWVSMGELGLGDGALEAALNDIPTGAAPPAGRAGHAA